MNAIQRRHEGKKRKLKQNNKGKMLSVNQNATFFLKRRDARLAALSHKAIN